MAGSEAEERIRAKVEAAFRRNWPDARIIHELVLDQGGVRIDLAAVTPSALYVAEIKSERDVLKRLPSQVEIATAVAQQVWVVVAEKHVPAVRQLNSYHVLVPRDPPYVRPSDGKVFDTRLANNPDRLLDLQWCHLKTEADGDGLTFFDAAPRHDRRPEPSRMLDMLHRSELAWIVDGGGRATREAMIRVAIEAQAGGAIRRAVCTCLRARPFPRADPAVSFKTNGARSEVTHG